MRLSTILSNVDYATAEQILSIIKSSIYDDFKSVAAHLSMVKSDGDVTLIFDHSDEFWIVKNKNPIWRSSDYKLDDTVNKWNEVAKDKISFSWLEEKMEKDVLVKIPVWAKI